MNRILGLTLLACCVLGVFYFDRVLFWNFYLVFRKSWMGCERRRGFPKLKFEFEMWDGIKSQPKWPLSVIILKLHVKSEKMVVWVPLVFMEQLDMGFSVTFLKWWFLHDSCFSKTGGLGGCFSRSLPGLMCFMGIQRIKFWLYHYTSFCTLVKERFHYSFFSHGEVQLFSLYIISKD